MARSIFYSWQNDLDSNAHRYFIEKCLKKALTDLEKDADIYMNYDRDTKGINGSPDITTTIFDKIDKSVLFVCDVSIVNSNAEGRKMPNPNVLVELGYAASKLGWDRIVCLFDGDTGYVEDLPFDLRQKRVTPFYPNRKNELSRVSKILGTNISDLYVKGQLFNPLNDYMKGKIDRSILGIVKPIANLVYGTISLSEGLAHVSPLLKCSTKGIEKHITDIHFPAFIVLNDFDIENTNLQDILKDLFSSSYFPKEWSYTVLELIDWIREYNWFISKRNKTYPFEKIDSSEYDYLAAISAKAINPNNPNNSFLVLETTTKDGKRYVDTDGGKVINTTHYPTDNAPSLRICLSIKPSNIKSLAEKIYKLVVICQNWLDITDSEFILDPDYYVIT